MKKCKLQLNGKEITADFYGVYQYSRIVDLQPMRGRLEEGIITLPVAVVDYGCGLEKVDISKVKAISGRSLRNFFRSIWNEF